MENEEELIQSSEGDEDEDEMEASVISGIDSNVQKEIQQQFTIFHQEIETLDFKLEAFTEKFKISEKEF